MQYLGAGYPGSYGPPLIEIPPPPYVASDDVVELGPMLVVTGGETRVVRFATVGVQPMGLTPSVTRTMVIGSTAVEVPMAVPTEEVMPALRSDLTAGALVTSVEA